MKRLVLVFVGSGLGGGLRYLVGGWAQRWLGSAFPFGTLGVNVIGSFLIMVFMHLGLNRGLLSAETRIFLTTGVMGGLTTYSTFNYETTNYFREGAWLLGATNVAATLAGCLVAGLAGLALARLFVR